MEGEVEGMRWLMDRRRSKSAAQRREKMHKKRTDEKKNITDYHKRCSTVEVMKALVRTVQLTSFSFFILSLSLFLASLSLSSCVSPKVCPRDLLSFSFRMSSALSI